MIIRELDFYTDGAYSSKTEMGGWAMVCIEDDKMIINDTGYEPYTTGNRMELTAFLAALEYANEIETGHTKVTINTDSDYIARCFRDGWYRNWMKNGWKTADKKDVKNQDLWKRIITLYIKNSKRLTVFEINKVKAHKDNKWNNFVDMMAVRSRKRLEDDK